MLQDYPISQLEVVRTRIQAAPFPGYFCSGHNLVITFANEAAFKAWGKNETIIGLPLAQGCKSIDENLEISVSDSGIGISTKDQEDLFKRFYRVVNQQTKNVSGFGIGLYLTAEILWYHDSTIQIKSEPGHGSKFYFSLPAGFRKSSTPS